MWKRLLLVLVLAIQSVAAETLKTTFNPFTNKLDYVTKVDSGTVSALGFVLKSGDTMTGNLIFNSSSIGPVLTDSNNCQWLLGAATTGNLTTTSLGCIVNTTGQCMGLLCAITYP